MLLFFRRYDLVLRQQPEHSRVCGLGEKGVLLFTIMGAMLAFFLTRFCSQPAQTDVSSSLETNLVFYLEYSGSPTR